MIYIHIRDDDTRRMQRYSWPLNSRFTQYREWLEENAGVEDIDWKWLRGDLHARGVYILDENVAVMFRLRFEL